MLLHSCRIIVPHPLSSAHCLYLLQKEDWVGLLLGQLSSNFPFTTGRRFEVGRSPLGTSEGPPPLEV